MIRDENTPVNGPLNNNKATEYVANLRISNFQASSGRRNKFKKQHGILLNIKSSESSCVSDEHCSQWQNTFLKTTLKEYEPDNVFNMDGTGNFFSRICSTKPLPSKPINVLKEGIAMTESGPPSRASGQSTGVCRALLVNYDCTDQLADGNLFGYKKKNSN
ncbi:hypothetical protein AVEN_154882-1 [Araneus ventricosus]|uniref:Uncharacterized protein n=1 Tax=Araneus ventricosus TaxID=182803 RepID=A0A4Y2A7Z4_ARAVE|nr:hypothetical protein AVEN_154882-1 [Araneus ventricosus]